MKIDPFTVVKEDRFKHLTKTEKLCRIVAIAVAFVGVFVWFFKVVFGVP